MAEEMDGQEHLDGEEDIGSTMSSQPTKKKGRGPSKGVQIKTPMFLEFDEFNLPTGKWEEAYGTHIGVCAAKVDINIREWKELGKVAKDSMWDEMKRKFHFEDDPEGERKRLFLKAVDARFRRRKSWLVSRFITRETAPNKGNPNADKKPWELYEGFITETQWRAFEEYVLGPKFQALSKKGKKNAAENVHRHCLGRKSYGRARKQWKDQKRLPESTPTQSTTTDGCELSSTTISERVRNRPVEWVMAREKKMPDGTWTIDPSQPETVRIANLVRENLEKEAKEKKDGKTTPSERGMDALSSAMGKIDHRGHVKALGGCGVGVNLVKAFGKEGRKGKRSSQTSFSVEEVEKMKATWEKELDDRLEEKVQSRLQDYEVKFEETMEQRVTMQVQSLLASITQGSGGFKNPDIRLLGPNLSQQQESLPHVVEISSRPSKKSKSQVDSCGNKSGESSALGLQLMEADELEKLGEQCELLYYCMTESDQMHDTTCVPLEAKIFYLEEDLATLVKNGDVSEFLRGACANITLIHVYTMFLIKEYIEALSISEITFLCPQRISYAEIQSDRLKVQKYLQSVFKTERMKGDKRCKFILAPYVQKNHWTLLVIDLQLGFLFVFDPATPPHIMRTVEVMPLIKTAYKVQRAFYNRNALVMSKKEMSRRCIECPQQPGATESGYYVMRYMYEIVSRHSECKGMLDKVYVARKKAFTIEEINEVREQWAKFFRLEYLLE